MLSGHKKWSLEFSAQLSVPASCFMPDISVWHLVLWQEGFQIKTEIYPDKVDGISATFQHQSYNNAGAALQAWTSGNPCLENTLAVFGQHILRSEPEELPERISWRINRLLRWIDAAAMENLAILGDPLELPAFPKLSPFSVIGFNEVTESLRFWESMTGKWGYASSSSFSGAPGTRFLREFFDCEMQLLRATKWSPFMCKLDSVTNAVWHILPGLPLMAPWQAPRTWEELHRCFSNFGVPLSDLLAEIGCSVRTRRIKRMPGILLLGCPLQEKVGGALVRIHWLALQLTGLSDSMTKRNGFRSTERNRRAWDRELPVSKEPIQWLRTQNWASDQLRTRGEAGEDIRSKKVLIIGAGSLGSAVAENLLRMGVVRLGILDADLMQAGNLSRHALTMTSIGKNKAVALAEHLNSILPDADARSFDCAFPPENDVIKSSLRSYDAVIDCTGDDVVLKAMAAFDWRSEKLFISLAMTWRAEGLFAFATSETRFPAIDAINLISNTVSPEIILSDARIEGIGCWHPVFPARADDLQLWAALGTKFICRVNNTTGRVYEYFKQMPDGTVERQAHEY